MLEGLKQRIGGYIRVFSMKMKWVLVILNIILFYITFQYAAYIALSMGRYTIYVSPRTWIYQSQWSFLVACAIAAAVFLGVAWRSMSAPMSVLQMISLFAAPVAFFGIFGELIYAMV